MKKFKKKSLAILLLIFTMSILPPAIAKADIWSVTTLDIYLRATDSWNANKMTVIPYGDLVSVISKGAEWSKVNYFGKIGYVPNDYITSNGTVSTDRYVISTDAVNVRSGAGTSNSVVRLAQTGTKAKVLGVTNNWYKLNVGGVVGYSLSDYWKDSGSQVTPSTPSVTTTTPATTSAPVTSAPPTIAAGKIMINNDIRIYSNAADAMSRTNYVTTYSKGEYFVYKTFNGMINITKVQSSPGGWVNPADNKTVVTPPVTTKPPATTTPAATTKPPTTTTPVATTKPATTTTPAPTTTTKPAPLPGAAGSTYVLYNDVPGYVNADYAARGVNSVVTMTKGSYFVYKTFSGMANITTKAGVPGAWINPANNVITTVVTPPVTTKPAATTTPVATTKPATTTTPVVTTKPPTTTPVSTSAAVNSLIKNWDIVNLRDIPSVANSKVLMTVPVNTTAKVIQTAVNGWYKLEINGVQGYSSATYWGTPAANLTPKAGYENTSITKIGQLRTNSPAQLRSTESDATKLPINIPSGQILDKLGESALWYKVSYSNRVGYIKKSEADILQKFAEPAIPTTGNKLVVFLDPGHDGVGYGAVSTFGGVRYDEATINWNVALKTKAVLEARGYTVYLSKSSINAYVDLYDRITTANQLQADIYVSIHNDVSYDSSVRGAAALYSTEKLNPTTEAWLDNSMLLARYLAEGIGTVMGSGKIFDDVPYTDGSLAVNRMSDMPSSLLELGFLTNQNDAVILNNPTNQQRLADQIANGIDKYFGR